MFLRQYFRKEHGRRQAYWALVESYRTVRGPRQRVVAWLGRLDEAGRLGIEQAAKANTGLSPTECQQPLFQYEDQPTQPRWVEVDTAGVRVENCRQFGGPSALFNITSKITSFPSSQHSTLNFAIGTKIVVEFLFVIAIMEPTTHQAVTFTI